MAKKLTILLMQGESSKRTFRSNDKKNIVDICKRVGNLNDKRNLVDTITDPHHAE